MELAEKIMKVKDDKAINRLNQLFQEVAMSFHFICRIRKSEIFKSYGAFAGIVHALKPVNSYAQCRSRKRNSDRCTFVKIFSGHKTKVFGDMIEFKVA